MNQLQNYRKFVMNKLSATHNIVEYIENALILEDDVAKHSFHKIMINHWPDGDVQLFEVLNDYFDVTVIPVLFTNKNNITIFYTSSLLFVLKVIKLDFMFPYARNIYNVDILFNDKTSWECFGEKITIDDFVGEMVSARFSETFELNLSNFCKDPGFAGKKIYFYDLSLLSYFKILMLRMGRDTKFLNLSNNNLSQIPLKIINFFIKGELIGVNLSNNNIPSFTELQRISSKIEKLWVEGNPLCENVDPITYMKQIVQKFPRLTELDGVKLNEHGIMMPFYKNYLIVQDKKTRLIVEKFISLYFSHYDSSRMKIDMFYDLKAQMTFSSSLADTTENKKYSMHSRDKINPTKNEYNGDGNHVYKNRAEIVTVLTQLPETLHDLTTFTTDVLRHDNKILMLVIDGTYKDIATAETPERILQFRRTFIFEVYSEHNMTYYTIKHEMFSVSLAPPEIVKNAFLYPIRNLSQFNLINPEQEDKNLVCTAFMHLTQLKKTEAEARLLVHDWDICVAMTAFIKDLKNDKIPPEKFYEDEETSDTSSHDEID